MASSTVNRQATALKLLKKKCQIPKKKFFPAPSSHYLPPPPPKYQKIPPRGWWWKVVGGRGRVEFCFWNLTLFFYIQFKNTSNLISSSFKVPSKSIFPKDFKTGLIFWHMWFFNFQNLVRSCQHMGGTLCILYIVEGTMKAKLSTSSKLKFNQNPLSQIFFRFLKNTRKN